MKWINRLSVPWRSKKTIKNFYHLGTSSDLHVAVMIKRRFFRHIRNQSSIVLRPLSCSLMVNYIWWLLSDNLNGKWQLWPLIFACVRKAEKWRFNSRNQELRSMAQQIWQTLDGRYRGAPPSVTFDYKQRVEYPADCQNTSYQPFLPCQWRTRL